LKIWRHKILDLSKIIEYAHSKNAVTESTPFGDNVLVYKVGNKMFLLLSLASVPNRVSVKCDPEYAVELREKFNYVIAGYHLNKTHWNTIILENEVNFEFIKEQIDNSYDLIVNSLSKKLRSEILKLTQ
jgi:predicted DNA-binding protein (MmcQ/YjbR family)